MLSGGVSSSYAGGDDWCEGIFLAVSVQAQLVANGITNANGGKKTNKLKLKVV